MTNSVSRYRSWRASAALLAVGCCAALACSSNDDAGGGAGGTAPGSAGSTSSAGAGARGGAGASSGGAAPATGGSGAVATGGTGTGGASGSGGSGSGGTSMSGASGSGGSAVTTGGAGGMNGAGAPGGGAPGAGSGGTSAGTSSGAGMTGSGGAAMAGAGGAPAGGAGGSGGSTKSFSCNQVVGIDSTSEWYMAGFETYVPDGKWQLIYHHPGYVEDWGKANDDVWNRNTTPVTSPCTMNSDNPDRVIFNLFADGSDSSITNKAAFATAIAAAITQFKAHYSNLKRIDLLTMTRAPMNMACSSSNAAGSMIPQYEDDAVQMEVSSGMPAVVASPPFFAMSCSDFDSTGGPHFSDAGKTNEAKLYGMYYAAEP